MTGTFIYIFSNADLKYFAMQVAEEIWICENQTVTKWEGDILSYKEMLKKKVMKDNEKRKKMF